jgi:predicted  nucleic acid-binding Zn-ribbon protein
MAAAKLKDELEQLQQELTTLTEESEEARRRRAERRDAAIGRWQAIGDSVQKHAKQITPLVLIGAVVLGVLVGRRLAGK